MNYAVTHLQPHELHTGTFSHNGEVYHIDAEGNLYIWDDHGQLGGFFKKIGKIFKKAGKLVGKVVKKAVKVAPYAALAYTGYGFATALASGASVGAAASAALTGPSSIIGKVAQGVQMIAGGGGKAPAPTPIVVDTSPPLPGSAQAPIAVTSDGSLASAVGNVLPAATAAVTAYYGLKTAQAQAAAGIAPTDTTQAPPMTDPNILYAGSNVVPIRPGEAQGVPSYTNAQTGFIQPTTERKPQGIPDVSGFGGTLAKYKTPLMIGGGLLLLALLAGKRR